MRKIRNDLKSFFIVFGAPGSGKGTYSNLLQKEFNLDHISTGD